MCDAQRGRRKQSSLGTGEERAANRLKKSAVKTVCKETSVSREVFQDPGFMTGTRDFKATLGQDSRSKVCTGSGCWKYSTVSDKKKTIVRGCQRYIESFPTEVKKILRKKARWPLLLVQHVQFSKLKYSYNLNDRVFLFSAKTYQILWTRCLLLSIWSVTKQNEV